MYMIVNLDLKWGETEAFYEAMPKLKAIMEEAGLGVKMLCGFNTLFGQMFRIVHIWETPTADAFINTVNHAIAHKAFLPALEGLKNACQTEVLMFAEQVPYSPGLIGK